MLFGERYAIMDELYYEAREVVMKLKQGKQELMEYVERIRDGEGNAVIDVNLGDAADIYDPLSMKGDLSGDIYDYIEKETNIIPAAIPLRIRFHGDVKEEEQEEIKKIMRRHYVMKSFDISWDLVANFKKTLGLVIFGAIVLAVYLYYAIVGENMFFTEILSIVGSFSLWEAADAFLLERAGLRRDYRNNEQSLNQKIEFVPNVGNGKADGCEGDTSVRLLTQSGEV